MVKPTVRVTVDDAYEIRLRLDDMGDHYDGGRVAVRLEGKELAALGLDVTQSIEVLSLVTARVDEALRKSGHGQVDDSVHTPLFIDGPPCLCWTCVGCR